MNSRQSRKFGALRSDRAAGDLASRHSAQLGIIELGKLMHKLTLQLPDDVYAPLLDRAKRIGRTPEEVATECVANAVVDSSGDPLIALLGSIDADMTDVSARHDEYIARGLLKEARNGG